MARPIRIEYRGAFYHVTARGNERKRIFFNKADYQKFKEYVSGAQDKFTWSHCRMCGCAFWHFKRRGKEQQSVIPEHGDLFSQEMDKHQEHRDRWFFWRVELFCGLQDQFKIFGKVKKRQENQEGCSRDHDGSVPSQDLTPNLFTDRIIAFRSIW